jgi:hypothetical protein
MIALLRQTGPRISLDEGFRLDCLWWKQFATIWNGVALVERPLRCNDWQIELFTDASGRMCAGYLAGEFFQFEFDADRAAGSIGYKELLAIVITAWT